MKAIILTLSLLVISTIGIAQVRIGSGGNGSGFVIEHNAGRAGQMVTFPGISDENDFIVNGLSTFTIPPGYNSNSVVSLRWDCKSSGFVSLLRYGTERSAKFVNVRPGRYLLTVHGSGQTLVEKKSGQALVYELRELKVEQVPPGTRVLLRQKYRDSDPLNCGHYANSNGFNDLDSKQVSQGQSSVIFKVLPGGFSIEFTDGEGRKTSLDDIRVD